jgi:Xaa-Pro aminopeptidase
MGIKELNSILDKNSMDIALFYNTGKTNPNMYYFSGYSGAGALIIAKKRPFLIVPKMEAERAKKSKIKVFTMEKKRFFEEIAAIIKKSKTKAKKIAIDKSSFTLSHYRYFRKYFKKIKTKDISRDCYKLREIKSNNELKLIKKSCYYAGKILNKAINNFREFKTEAEVAAFLEYETKKLGLRTAFDPVVASGSNASMPHHEPSTKIKRGFCVMDFGVKYKGYCSDMTRTIYLGKPGKKEKEIYNFLLSVQKNTIKNIRVNDSCNKIYKNCVREMKSYSKYFIHGLGHGVGIEIHELPNINLDSKDKIRENIAFTIEPGIYMPKKLGIRIEDTIIMKKKPYTAIGVTKDLLIV